jgi:hypothetical protein
MHVPLMNARFCCSRMRRDIVYCVYCDNTFSIYAFKYKLYIVRFLRYIFSGLAYMTRSRGIGRRLLNVLKVEVQSGPYRQNISVCHYHTPLQGSLIEEVSRVSTLGYVRARATGT